MNTRLWMRRRVYNREVRALQTHIAFLWLIIIGLIMQQVFINISASF